MGVEVDNHSSNSRHNEDAELKTLENQFKSLQDEAQNLLQEKRSLQNEITELKKKASGLDNELRILRSPPLTWPTTMWSLPLVVVMLRPPLREESAPSMVLSPEPRLT